MSPWTGRNPDTNSELLLALHGARGGSKVGRGYLELTGYGKPLTL